MSEAKITVIGFNNYMESINDDLFKYFVLPDGIDVDTVKNNILIKGGDFEVLYSDPFFMQQSIDVWSKKWFDTFAKWYKALTTDYAPLENYDRIEEWTDKNTGKDTHIGSGNVDTTTELDNKTIDDSSSTTEHKVSAFDASTYQEKDLEENKYDNTTDFESDGKTHTETSDSKTIDTASDHTHNGHIHGNIGVTTSQAMLEAELNVRRFSLIENITDVFLREYTIPIY